MTRKNSADETATNADWQSIRIFLETARGGSFSAAASTLGLSINIVRRRVAALERSLGTSLLTRTANGIRLTAEGEDIILAAEKMEEGAFELMQTRDGSLGKIQGSMKVAINSALASFWLMPRLVDFQKKFSDVRLDVFSAIGSSNILKLDADLSIQFANPASADLKVQRLGRQHLCLAASPGYFAANGTPQSINDLANHQLVTLSSPLAVSNIKEWLRDLNPDKISRFRTNNQLIQVGAVLEGAGIGWVPTYVFGLGLPLQPLDIGMVFSEDIWLSYRRSMSGIPRMRKLVSWITRNFDATVYPWFADDYVPPAQFGIQERGSVLSKFLPTML